MSPLTQKTTVEKRDKKREVDGEESLDKYRFNETRPLSVIEAVAQKP